MAIGIAVLGAGIFAREEHVPAVQACSLLSLKAIYSRSPRSAKELAGSAGVEAYFDSPATSSRSLDDLLARSDIQAVIVALPILAQPDIIKKAITAGKHVLSEKPIAKDMKTANGLVQWYNGISTSTIWSVAENFRFLEVFVLGADRLKEIGGNVVTFSFKLFALIDRKDKFFQTQWRQTPEYQGGFLLDGGVHFVAGLRLLLSAAGQEITRLAAFTSQLQEALASVDTVEATMQISNGNNGTFVISFGTKYKSGFEAEVVADKGRVTVTPTEVAVVTEGADGQQEESKTEFTFSAGVKQEVVAFAESVKAGKGDARATPQQARTDLMILQSMLESGQQGGSVRAVSTTDLSPAI